MIIDLSHLFHDGMPGVTLPADEGSVTELTARIRPYLTHARSLAHYRGKSSFEITDVTFQTSVGTKMDAPRHRFEGASDIASISLDRVILEGVVVDARHARPGQELGLGDLQLPHGIAGKAVLVNFGWDRYWGCSEYHSHPFVGRDVLDSLQRSGIGLLGVDCANVDSTLDPERPAHTWLLQKNILIVENLTSLDQLHPHSFRFFSIPLKARDAAAFPVRAFAELL